MLVLLMRHGGPRILALLLILSSLIVVSTILLLMRAAPLLLLPLRLLLRCMELPVLITLALRTNFTMTLLLLLLVRIAGGATSIVGLLLRVRVVHRPVRSARMRVRAALAASVAAHLFHELVHKLILIVFLDHSSYSILEKVYFELCVRVNFVVHVQLFACI